MRGRRLDPRHLDVEAFAERAAVLDGSLALEALARLLDQVRLDALPDGEPPVRWQAHGERRTRRGGEAQSWLHLQVQASLAMTCQRCLQAMPVPLALDCSYRFVADEAAAAEADIDTEEDLLPTTRSFDLASLIEDELLMALPIVPRHEGACPQPLVAPAVDLAFDAQTSADRKNPFEVLAALKTPKPGR